MITDALRHLDLLLVAVLAIVVYLAVGRPGRRLRVVHP